MLGSNLEAQLVQDVRAQTTTRRISRRELTWDLVHELHRVDRALLWISERDVGPPLVPWTLPDVV